MLAKTQTDPQSRPALRAWRRSNRYTKVAAAQELGVSTTQITRYELPFNDPKRQIPGTATMERIHAFTGGALTPADFYPEHLRPAPCAPAEAPHSPVAEASAGGMRAGGPNEPRPVGAPSDLAGVR